MVPHHLTVSFEIGLRCIQIGFHKSSGKRWQGEWREKESSPSAVFTVWSLGGILSSWRVPAFPPLTLVREGRPGGGDLCHMRGRGRVCQAPVFSSQGQDPPSLPLLYLNIEKGDTEHHEGKGKGGPLLRRLRGGTALGRAGGQTGAAAAGGCAAGPAA